jgi:hypothetical protein
MEPIGFENAEFQSYTYRENNVTKIRVGETTKSSFELITIRLECQVLK